MNILILNWKDIKNPSAGGAELVTYEHAKRWAKKGHTITWFASSFKNSKKEEVLEGIKIRRFGNIYSVYLYAPFYYLFSGNKFDIVVDEVHGIPFFTPLYVRRPKLVLIHEIASEIWDYMYPVPINYLGKFLEKVYLKIYVNNYFWTDSNATIDELVQNGIDRRKCLSIPSPSNLKVLENTPLKGSKPNFIWVSRIVKMKGIEDVLIAFNYIFKKYPEATLNIIGDGDKKYISYLKKNFIEKYNLSEQVLFYGYLSEKEKIKLLKKSHILLHASVKEGWGIVVIEAASQATPSVVYNVPGLSESVKNRKTGIVLKNNSPKSMSEEAIKLFEDKNLYNELQKGALSWAKRLNWDNEAERSLKIIKQLTSK